MFNRNILQKNGKETWEWMIYGTDINDTDNKNNNEIIILFNLRN